MVVSFPHGTMNRQDLKGCLARNSPDFLNLLKGINAERRCLSCQDLMEQDLVEKVP
jgi:hypothetical protein